MKKFNSYVSFSIILFLISCNHQRTSTLDMIQSLVRKDITSKKAIIVIDDHDCLSCNQEFMNITLQYMNRKDFVFIISANGNKIDLSPFIDKNNNVVFDKHKLLYKKGVITTSTIFFIKNGQIDTAVEMRLNELAMIKQFIDNRLKNDMEILQSPRVDL